MRSTCIPTQSCKTPRAVGCGTGVPWWCGKVAPWAWRAWRRRDANAAYTSQHPVITITSAMSRAGVWRYRDEASTRGSLRQRQPRAACPGPCSPSRRAWGGSGVASRALGAKRTHRWRSPRAGRVALRDARAPAIPSTTWSGGRSAPGRPRLPSRAVERTGLGVSNVACQLGAQVESACCAAAAPAQAVRHRRVQALTACARCWRHGVSTVRWA